MSVWKIPEKNSLNLAERQQYWAKTHLQDGFETVWSLTQDPFAREKLIAELLNLSDCSSILLPGCGTHVFLQTELAELEQVQKIHCTDFSKVVDFAKERFKHQKVTYAAEDLAKFKTSEKYSVVMPVNSVVSESHQENTNILTACYDALKPDGTLIGYFPTIFWPLDIAHLLQGEQKSAFIDRVDVANSTFHESQQDCYQIFYTPLRIRQLFKSCGFEIKKLEIVFFDSPSAIEETNQVYQVSDPDLVAYEMLIVAHK